jgi:copper chaperone CopZ
MNHEKDREEFIMNKITVKIDGMMCGMCESHINNAIRSAFSVKKVTSSHTKGETVILTEEPLSEAQLRSIIDPTGYQVQSVTVEPYEKKGILGLFKK